MQETQGEEGTERAPAVQPKNNAPIVTVALIEASSKLFWPIVVCWALLMFEKPIYSAVDAAAKQITGGGATVEIAGVKINLPKNAIPIAPERVKNILPKLDSDDIHFIIENQGGNTIINICYQDANPDDFKGDSVYSRLKKLEMITFEIEQLLDGNGKQCAAAAKTKYTHLYDQVRSYLITVLAAKFGEGSNF